MKYSIASGLGLLIMFYTLSGLAAEPVIDWTSLQQGQILTEKIRSPDGLPGLRAQFLVTAPRARIWAALIDYNNFPRFFTGIEQLRVLRQGTDSSDIEITVDAILKRFRFTLRRDYVVPEHRLTWRRLSGDLDRLEGYWEIRDSPWPGQQRIIYVSFVKVSDIVPTRLIRLLAIRKARQMLGRFRDWVEKASIRKPRSLSPHFPDRQR